jgi:hypothetical protein
MNPDDLLQWFEGYYKWMIGYASKHLGCCPDRAGDCVHDYWIHATRYVFPKFDVERGIPLEGFLRWSFCKYVGQWRSKNCGVGGKGKDYAGDLPHDPDDRDLEPVSEVEDSGKQVADIIDVPGARTELRRWINANTSRDEKRLYILKHVRKLADLSIARYLGVKPDRDGNLNEIANELRDIPSIKRKRSKELVGIAESLREMDVGPIPGESERDFRKRLDAEIAGHAILSTRLNGFEDDQIRARIANRLRLMHERLDACRTDDKLVTEICDVIKDSWDRTAGTGQVIPDSYHGRRLKERLEEAKENMPAHIADLEQVSAIVQKLLGEQFAEKHPSSLRGEAVEILSPLIEKCPAATANLSAIIRLIGKVGPPDVSFRNSNEPKPHQR